MCDCFKFCTPVMNIIILCEVWKAMDPNTIHHPAPATQSGQQKTIWTIWPPNRIAVVGQGQEAKLVHIGNLQLVEKVTGP